MATETIDTQYVPQYNPLILGADNHNIGNSGFSIFDPSTYGEKASNIVKFSSAAIVSGASSLTNSAITAANWFGADMSLANTNSWMMALDSDLAKYYDQNRESVDLAGFIAGGFAPGLGGVKLLQAGQAALKASKVGGFVGANLGSYTGMLTNGAETYITLAKGEIAAQQAAFSLMSANTVKALGTGLVQNTLEAGAFEIFATAAQFKSPVLEHQDVFDITKNIITGAAVGGVIGGAFSTAGTFWKLGRARLENDAILRPANSREFIQQGTRPDDAILAAVLNRQNTLSAIESLPPLAANPTAEELAVYNFRKAAYDKAVETKSASINNTIRTNLRDMHTGSGNDTAANMLADSLIPLGDDTIVANIAGAVAVSPMRKVLKTKTVDGVKHVVLSDGTTIAEANVSSRYVKLTGEDVGSLDTMAPLFPKLADRVYPDSGQTIESAVSDAIKTYGFKQKDYHDPLVLITKAEGWKEAEGRHIWMDRQVNLMENAEVSPRDFAMLTAYAKAGRNDISILGPKGVPIKFDTVGDLVSYIENGKVETAVKMLASKTEKTPWINTDTIAKSLDVDKNFLEGVVSGRPGKTGLYAREEAAAAYKEFQKSIGKSWEGSIDYVPEYSKIYYDTSRYEGVNGHIVDALGTIAARQKTLVDDTKRVVAKQAGSDIVARLENIDLNKVVTANSQGAGSGFLTFARGGYDSTKILASVVQRLGGVTRALKQNIREDVDSTIQGTLYNLKLNKEAVAEAQAINQQISRTTEQYVLDSENLMGYGETAWVPKKHLDVYRAAGEEGDITLPSLQQGAPEYIVPKNWETSEFLQAHQKLTSKRTVESSERWAVLGKSDSKSFSTEVLRPWREDPKQFPYFAFVKDERVTGAGHTTMLFANTDEQLQALASKVNRDFGSDYKVYFKADTEEFKKAHGDYLYERGLNENYIDSSLKSKGVYSDTFTKSDPEAIVNSILQYHYRAADTSAAEIIRTRYNDAFAWLHDQGSVYSRVESSKFGGLSISKIEATEQNPYLSYIKTALDLHSLPQNNLWQSANRILDNAVSSAVGKFRTAFDNAKSPAELEATNSILKEYGFNTAIANSAEYALVNHTAPAHELSKFVRTANSVMSRFTLGLDPLNAAVNAISANILRGTELSMVTRAIAGGDEALVGKLAMLTKTGIPGAPDTIVSPAKLIANSAARFWNPTTGPALRAEYRQLGITSTRLEQFASIADDIALKGTETVSELGKIQSTILTKARNIIEVGEKYSGNPIAEEFNRFVSADVMRQITDVAVAGGHFTQEEALTYINTFVNRVEGNIIASQRPGVFQGPIGQAIGLFQSYQFNLMQNMFRYVAEGERKDVAMLLGLQGTFYGLQGEPGFKLINDHIIGTMSGNKDHRDTYDAARGIAGKQAGDWLMYGAASNIMQTNVYSRGDINPRQLTVLPTSLSEIPFVGGISKVFGSLYNTAQKIGDGGAVWESIRQGIEHNGVYRPLAGLATVSSAIGNSGTSYSTSGKGTIIGSNDLFSLATLSRLAGGRPLDEAIVNDAMFTTHSYEAADRAAKENLAEAVKSTVIGKNAQPTENETAKFAARYAELGGKQGSFNRYMSDQFLKANTSQAQLLASKLSSPLSYKAQALLGGDTNGN